MMQPRIFTRVYAFSKIKYRTSQRNKFSSWNKLLLLKLIKLFHMSVCAFVCVCVSLDSG